MAPERAVIGDLSVRCNMPRATANIGRVCLGVLMLFAAWVVGGFLGSMVFPDWVLVGGRDPRGEGGEFSSHPSHRFDHPALHLAIFGLALVCLAGAEIIVLFVVMGFSGLTTLTLTNIRFNGWWVSHSHGTWWLLFWSASRQVTSGIDGQRTRRCRQQPLRPAVDRLWKLEHHHRRPRPPPAAVPDLDRSPAT